MFKVDRGVYEEHPQDEAALADLLGISRADFAILQRYIRSLQAENKWFRGHPSFKSR